MGYDLEWVDLPEPASTARARWKACCASGLPCDHLTACSESYFDLAEPFQFHLNVSGMGFCRNGMRLTGMTYQAEARPFPTWPFANTDDWRTADQGRRDAYDAAERSVAPQVVPGQVGIPEFKLLSNDDWVVSTNEIEQALTRYQESPAAARAELEADEFWLTWLGWMREAAAHGGFVVG